MNVCLLMFYMCKGNLTHTKEKMFKNLAVQLTKDVFTKVGIDFMHFSEYHDLV